MKTVLFIICLCFIFDEVHAQSSESWKVKKVIYVYDGDTFRCDIDEPNLPSIISKNIPIRLSGVDTPEIKGSCTYEKEKAIKARDFVRQKLSTGNTIILRNIKRGKYFRIVADVYIDDVNLSDLLLQNELAYPYEGGTKLGWCE